MIALDTVYPPSLFYLQHLTLVVLNLNIKAADYAMPKRESRFKIN